MWRDLEGGTADWCCANVIGRQHCRDTRVRCVLFAVCFVVENVFVIAVRKRHDIASDLLTPPSLLLLACYYFTGKRAASSHL